MKDTIYREDAIEAIQTYCKPCKERGDDAHGVMCCSACRFNDAMCVIDSLPSAEPPKGELISRADAIEAVCGAVIDAFDVSPTRGYEVSEKALSALPSADTPTESINTPTDTPTDLISRQWLLDLYENPKDGEGVDWKVPLEVVRQNILDAPSAEAVQRWIPCSERLPEIDETLRPCDQISEEVLGTDTYGNIRHVYLTNSGYIKPTFCTVEEGMSVDIVAWIPLPTPYKGGDDE